MTTTGYEVLDILVDAGADTHASGSLIAPVM